MAPPAVIAVIREDERVLAILRGSGVISPGWWTFPGGRIESGESEEAALVREMSEELALEVTPLRKVWECDTDDGDFRLHWWTVKIGAGELEPEPSEIAEARWVTPAEFLELEPTFVGDRDFVTRILPTL